MKNEFGYKESRSHCLLLSKFLYPRMLDDFCFDLADSSWENVLGEKPLKAIDRFQTEGLIVHADLVGKALRIIDRAELVKLSNQYGLPSIGKKSDIIRRIIHVNSEELKEATEGKTVFECSEQGKQVAEKFLAEEDRKIETAMDQTLNAIKQGDFKKACLIEVEYQRTRVFSRDSSIDWTKYDPTDDIATLKFIFSCSPNSISSIPSKQLAELKIATGMMFLWRAPIARYWLPEGFETGSDLYGDAAARKLLSHATHQLKKGKYHQAGIKTVEIVPAYGPSVCANCTELVNHTFGLDEVPDLPYINCLEKHGYPCLDIEEAKNTYNE